MSLPPLSRGFKIFLKLEELIHTCIDIERYIRSIRINRQSGGVIDKGHQLGGGGGPCVIEYHDAIDLPSGPRT
jgi:hypothetical protein